MADLAAKMAGLSPKQQRYLEERLKREGIDLSHHNEVFTRQDYARIPVAPEKEYYNLSSAQKRMYILNRIEGLNTVYNTPEATLIEGDLDRVRLEGVFAQLVKRHDAFRTAFVMVGGEPMQQIHRQVDFQITHLKADESKAPELIEGFIQPFDLSRAPLLRVGLIELSQRKHILVCDMHHIISDGSSRNILIEEFRQIYNGRELAELRIQYKDYSEWQNVLLQSEQIRRQEDYWLERFSGELPVLDLPTDYPRPAVQSFAGGNVKLEIDRELWTDINKLLLETGTTLYMVLLAAYNILLSKYTKKEDIVVGSPIAGRQHADLQNIVGMFVNTLGMRNMPAAEKTFRQFVTEVKENCLNAYANQSYQFETLIEKLNIERDSSRNPLFDTMLVLQNTDRPVRTSSNLHFQAYHFPNIISKFDLTLEAMEFDAGIRLNFEYCAKLFEKTTISRMANHFINILKAVCANPGVRLGEIPILADWERRTLLDDFNNTMVAYPQDQTVLDLFTEQVAQNPDRLSVIFGKEQWTYHALDARANQLANYLISQNIQPDSVVGMLMERSAQVVIAMLGIWKSGGAYLPLDPDLPLERIKAMLNELGIRVIVATVKQIKKLQELQWSCPSFTTFICIDSDAVAVPEGPQDQQLMDPKLWDYVADNATNEIAGGGWNSSYTGEEFSEREMEEYADNTLEKLKPYLNSSTRVLEIGCASGITMYQIAPRVALYYGTDLSKRMIAKNRQKIRKEGRQNIKLDHLAAHEIDQLRPEFDVIIINSVIQSFPGYNYLRDVIFKAIALLSVRGILYIGDVMDLDLKPDLAQSLQEFKQNHPQYGNKTKTEFVGELFVPRGFFEDLQAEHGAIKKIGFSQKIHTIANELSRFRYDAIFEIDQTAAGRGRVVKHKYQHGAGELPKRGNIPPKVTISPNNLAYVIYTSGSTGKPNGVLIEHRSIHNTIYWRKKEYRLGAADTVLQLLSYSFDGFGANLFTALASGSKLVILAEDQAKDPLQIKKAIQRQKVTHFALGPILYGAVLDSMTAEESQSLHSVTLAGEALSLKMAQRAKEKSEAIEIINEYGPTENSITTTICRNVNGARPPAIGRPIANTRVYILDQKNNLLPIGVPGELCISGHGLARGYVARPELTAAKFVPNPFVPGTKMYRTGDLVRWLPDGNLEFRGRIDQQVKIRGFRIEPDEIAGRLLSHEAIKEALVTAGEDHDHHQYLCAYFVADCELTIKELRKYLLKELPDYMIPAIFIRLDQMPVNAHGKPDRKALPEPEGDFHTGIVYEAPRNDREARLAKIWQELLNVAKIGINDNFFELGGHSLKAIGLVTRIYQEFGLEIPLIQVFKLATIKALADYLANVAQYTGPLFNQPEMVRLNELEEQSIFAFPPIVGYAGVYSHLAKLINGCSLYAFDFIEEANRLERYLQMITAVQKEGPYLLLGYSAGGNLAFEVAKVLEKNGYRIAALVMVDSNRNIAEIPDEDDLDLGDSLRQIAVTYLNGYENYQEGTVDPDYIATKMTGKTQSYTNYLATLKNEGMVKTEIHIIRPGEQSAVVEDGWGNATTISQVAYYPGAGPHLEMLSRPEYLKHNARIINEIIAAAPNRRG
jgi:amino acid adenylation domain-containing protein